MRTECLPIVVPAFSTRFCALDTCFFALLSEIETIIGHFLNLHLALMGILCIYKEGLDTHASDLN